MTLAQKHYAPTTVKTFIAVIAPAEDSFTVGLHGSADDSHEHRADPQLSHEHLISIDM